MTKRNGESVPDGHGNYHWFFRGQCGAFGIIPDSELVEAIQKLAWDLGIEDDSDPLVIFNDYHPVMTWRLAHAFTGIELTNWKVVDNRVFNVMEIAEHLIDVSVIQRMRDVDESDQEAM